MKENSTGCDIAQYHNYDALHNPLSINIITTSIHVNTQLTKIYNNILSQYEAEYAYM